MSATPEQKAASKRRIRARNKAEYAEASIPEAGSEGLSPLAGVEFQTVRVTRLAMAKLLGVTPEGMQALIRRGVMVFHPTGSTMGGFPDILKTTRNYIKALRDQRKDMAEPLIYNPTDEEVDAEQEYRRQKARMAKLQADQREGMLVIADEVRRERESEILRAKSRLNSMAAAVVSDLAPYLIPLEGGPELVAMLRERVEDKVAEALMELASVSEDDAMFDDGDEDYTEADFDDPV